MAHASVEFLAAVSEHCRKIIELAGVAIRDKEDYEDGAARESLKQAMGSHFRALSAILPEDFPTSRRWDLARHIKFCEPHDWFDIVLWDVPDVLAKAEQYALGMKQSDLSALDEFLHPSFRPRVELALQAEQPNYHDLLVACCTALATQFVKKSGATDDSDGEVGRIFSPNNPELLVADDVETETNKNRQRGGMLLMQGWRAFVRNPHAHGEQPTDEAYAAHALMLMSFLGRIIDGAKPAIENEDDTTSAS